MFIPKHQVKEYHLPGSLFNFDEFYVGENKGKMIIGKLDDDGWKIKEVEIPEREPIFCEVCGKEVKGKSIGERTEYPIHEMTKFIFCSGCQKKIRQDITEDLLEYEKQKVMEWVRKNREMENDR